MSGFFQTTEWEAHRAVLGRTLDEHAWLQVRGVYTAVAQLKRALAAGPGQPLTSEQRELVQVVGGGAAKARDTLDAATPVLE